METKMETPKGPVLIRKATPEDAGRLRALRLEALRTDPVAFSADLSIEEALTDAQWAERLGGYEVEQSGLIVVAEANGELVGMTGLGRGNRPKTQHNGTIWGVYVQPEWRGLRIADRLIEGCLDWARERGLTIVKLGVVNSNQPAIRAYTRLGFTVYGEEPKAIRYEGVDYDDLLMAKLLD